MKFDMHQYWKHQNCRDVFILINSVVQDTGEVAILNVQWMTQGIQYYWNANPDYLCGNLERIIIKAEEYGNWKPYSPKGSYYF